MTPDKFFEIFVEGNYEDYAENPECVQRAFNAAVSASHLADHYHAFFGRNEASARYSTVSLVGSVESVDVSDAHGDVAEVGNIVGCDAHGPKFETVMYRRKDGEWREFLPALKAVIEYWKGVLNGTC